MRTRCVTFGLALTAAAAARAQETATYIVKWDKAAVEAGEVQTGSVWVQFDPPVGSTTTWDTPPGIGQTATVKAFASSKSDLLNILNLNGGTGQLQWTVPSGFNVGNTPGFDDGNGGIADTKVSQFGPPANPNPMLDNPIMILCLMWTPADYTPRTVTFRAEGDLCKVYLDAGLAAWVGENAVIIDSSDSSFEVVPAPAAGLVVFAAASTLRRGAALLP